jgi:Protein of unknown function (DUF3631)
VSTAEDIERGRAIFESGKHATTDSHVPPMDEGDVPPIGEEVSGAELLDDLVTWFGRFIRVTHPDDLFLLALWTVHTYLVVELYTTPRLLIDSIMEGSGKTTVLDHLSRLCLNPIQAAAISSPALLPRLLEHGMRTILIDEAHRALRPDKPGVEDLLGIINTGYRVGATRPVLVPVKGGGWAADEMPTFAPVAMAGNNPNLPADTVSRQLRVLLMPDIDGTVEDSDWEYIQDDASALALRITTWADAVREDIKGIDPALPAGCIGRTKERWRPLARIATAAGGDWPAIVNRLIEGNMAEEADERDAGLKALPPGMVMMRDLYDIWPKDLSPNELVATCDLVNRLIVRYPEYWGSGSAYGKPLTEHRLGRLVSQSAKLTSVRIGGRGPRGYQRLQLEPVWRRLGITPHNTTGASGGTGASGAEPVPEAGCTGSTACTDPKETPTEAGCTGSTACTDPKETPTETGAPGGQRRRNCPGCGHYFAAHGVHRDDCTAV